MLTLLWFNPSLQRTASPPAELKRRTAALGRVIRPGATSAPGRQRPVADLKCSRSDGESSGLVEVDAVDWCFQIKAVDGDGWADAASPVSSNPRSKFAWCADRHR